MIAFTIMAKIFNALHNFCSSHKINIATLRTAVPVLNIYNGIKLECDFIIFRGVFSNTQELLLLKYW